MRILINEGLKQDNVNWSLSLPWVTWRWSSSNWTDSPNNSKTAGNRHAMSTDTLEQIHVVISPTTMIARSNGVCHVVSPINIAIVANCLIATKYGLSSQPLVNEGFSTSANSRNAYVGPRFSFHRRIEAHVIIFNVNLDRCWGNSQWDLHTTAPY